ncbi:DUF2953 domain-containing protein [Salsuginibacillus kocurii]|uniref:DUF2953 domain-containing protein n=1 Tax=Salsuginibacillus kocurii TaxID=427078 RepID=UPI000362EA17|nr:DUF2953 domain-containing protein [Salsuginibacillus kocurii]
MIWIFIGITLLLMVVALGILLTTVYFHVNYEHQSDDDQLTIRVWLWKGRIEKKWEVPLIAINEEGALIFKNRELSKQGMDESYEEETISDLIQQLKMANIIVQEVPKLQKNIRRMLKTIQVTSFKWISEVGTPDAPLSAKIVGSLWAVKGSSIGLMSWLSTLTCHPHLHISPIYDRWHTQSTLACMGNVKVGKTVWVAIPLVRHLRAVVKALQQIREMQKRRTNNE